MHRPALRAGILSVRRSLLCRCARRIDCCPFSPPEVLAEDRHARYAKAYLDLLFNKLWIYGMEGLRLTLSTNAGHVHSQRRVARC